ncbi:hypothetical protein M3P21_08715 [Ruegeria sp. 2012CJ41-6]|uniref:Uncharacterized protein n=1 Tax=Ruegeria spongiae TaxID=2942209 RepID=A0ABT0Q1Z1_9RHOB|nr:hypothetical protein [Ruegeria spongiae]MCL6283617.1 hypothetical protein [Ruegeria spongiae]
MSKVASKILDMTGNGALKVICPGEGFPNLKLMHLEELASRLVEPRQADIASQAVTESYDNTHAQKVVAPLILLKSSTTEFKSAVERYSPLIVEEPRRSNIDFPEVGEIHLAGKQVVEVQ